MQCKKIYEKKPFRKSTPNEWIVVCKEHVKSSGKAGVWRPKRDDDVSKLFQSDLTTIIIQKNLDFAIASIVQMYPFQKVNDRSKMKMQGIRV